MFAGPVAKMHTLCMFAGPVAKICTLCLQVQWQGCCVTGSRVVRLCCVGLSSSVLVSSSRRSQPV